MCFRVVSLGQGRNGMWIITIDCLHDQQKFANIFFYGFMPLRLPGQAHVIERCFVAFYNGMSPNHQKISNILMFSFMPLWLQV